MGLELETKGASTNGVGGKPHIGMDRQFFADWIIAQAKRKCCSFVLQHVTEVDKEPVATEDLDLKLKPGVERDTRVLQIVDSFDRASLAWASQFPRRATFLVAAYVDRNPDTKPEAQQPFTQMPPDQGYEDLPRGVERTTDNVAMAAQLQRALDKSEAERGRMSDRMMTLVERLIDREQNHHREQVELRMRMEEALDNRMAREVQAFEARINAQLKEKAMALAFQIGGAWAHKQFGSGQDLIEQLKLQPMQMLKIVNDLDPEQKKLLAPTIEKYLASMPDEDRQKFLSNPVVVKALGLGDGAADGGQQK